MTYEQFVQTVEHKVKEGIGEGVCVSIHTAQKYNGASRKGILFSEEKSNVSPAIYLEEYYHRFHEGDSLDAIVKEILKLHRRMRFRTPWDPEAIKDYKAVRERIVYRLINEEKNRRLLKEMPYVPWLDLAIVFYVLLEADAYGMAAMPVTSEHLNIWGATEEEVYEEACRNTKMLLPASFQTMDEVIEQLTGEEQKKETGAGRVYVISNRLRSFGASAILYPGFLEEIGRRLKDDYFVLPSSVHEAIIVPRKGSCVKELLDKMVAEINKTQVMQEEALSDRAYYYDRILRKLSM